MQTNRVFQTNLVPAQARLQYACQPPFHQDPNKQLKKYLRNSTLKAEVTELNEKQL